MLKHGRLKRPRPILRVRVPVLLVLSGDGVEVYGPPEVSVHVARRLAVDGTEAERLADEVLDLDLPGPYRQLYWPKNLRAVARCETLTPEQYADNRLVLDLLSEMGSLRRELDPSMRPAAIRRPQSKT